MNVVLSDPAVLVAVTVMTMVLTQERSRVIVRVFPEMLSVAWGSFAGGSVSRLGSA